MGAFGQITFFILAALIIILSILAVINRNLTKTLISMLGVFAITALFFFLTKYTLLAILQLVLFTVGTGVLTFYTMRVSGLTHFKMDMVGWKRPLVVAIGSAAATALTIITIFNFRFHGPAKPGITAMDEGITIHYFLALSAILFFIGIYGFLTRRNLIAILISSELIINSVSINFVTFNRYLYPQKIEGMLFSVFIVVIAVAEAALALAIIYDIFRQLKSVNIDDTGESNT